MSTTIKNFKSFLLVTLLFAGTVAQQTSPAPAPSVEHLRTHIEILAGEKFQGRRTGTQGANEAAEYIANEFKRLGLKPATLEVSLSRARGAVGKYNTHLQPFPYVSGVELGKQNKLEFHFVPNQESKSAPLKSASTVRMIVSDDWMPLGFTSQDNLEKLPVAFVGYGITSSELNWDDYANAKASGKIAVAFAGAPDGGNPHSPFARFKELRWKAVAARNAGAKALIVIADELNFKDDRLSRLRYSNSAGDAGLPVIAVSRQTGERLLSASPTMLTEIQKRLGEKQTTPVTEQVPALPQQPVTVSLTTSVVRREVHAANVIGILEGSDPVQKNEAIVIGAHYDHLGLGGEGSLATKEGDIHHGADDNASGTAGLIELARVFVSGGSRPKRTIVFIAFGGEEEGLLGSNYYVNHPVVPLANTVAMFNMDMIGRLKNKNLIVGGIGTAAEWRSLVEAANFSQGLTVSLAGIPRDAATIQTRAPIVVGANGQSIVTSDASKQFTLTLNEDGFGPSDHSSFYAKQIPVLFFWTGTHEDYHKPSDTAEKINYEDEARILSFIARLVRDVDSEAKRPTYAATKSPAAGRSTGGFNVSLGTIPNYGDSSDGLLIDGVRENSPAAMSGIQAGDKIVRLAGRDIRNVYDYTAALGEMRAGQEYDVELMRGGERLKLKIIPAARR